MKDQTRKQMLRRQLRLIRDGIDPAVAKGAESADNESLLDMIFCCGRGHADHFAGPVIECHGVPVFSIGAYNEAVEQGYAEKRGPGFRLTRAGLEQLVMFRLPNLIEEGGTESLAYVLRVLGQLGDRCWDESGGDDYSVEQWDSDGDLLTRLVGMIGEVVTDGYTDGDGGGPGLDDGDETSQVAS